MNLKELYRFIIEKGIETDPRKKNTIARMLASVKEKYSKLTEEEKSEFDIDKLDNPYSDSRILYSTGNENIKSILIGIDIETPELLLAHTLKQSGRKIDLVLAHHPEGRAYATLYDVMNIHSDVLHKFGVPINIAESITEPRLKEVSRRLMPANHSRPVDTARLLNIPFMSAHTPADNHVTYYLQSLFDKEQCNLEKLDDVIKLLKQIPEYKMAVRNSQGPVIIAGSKDRKPGKILVDMTGGTEGPADAIEKLANAGVGTIVGMHMSEEHYKLAEKYHVNVIIAGHISSDTVGLNLLLDKVEHKFGKLDIIECSGFTRIKRNK